MARLLIIVGLIFVALGLAWPLLARLGLGRLPGDIAMGNGNFSLYFPIVTCLLLSVAVSLVPWIINLTRYRSMIRGWPETHGTPWSDTGWL